MSTRAPATPTIRIDNDRLRVTEWRFAPGNATGWHRHEYDYCVVPITTGRLLIVDAAGDREAELITGEPYAREAGVEHDVVNPNEFTFFFIEVELK